MKRFIPLLGIRRRFRSSPPAAVAASGTPPPPRPRPRPSAKPDRLLQSTRRTRRWSRSSGGKAVGRRHRHRERRREAARPGREDPDHGLRRDHPRAAAEEVRRDHQRDDDHARAREAGRLRATYITVGAFLMVKKGNPSHITDARQPLSGKSVAVEAATTEKSRAAGREQDPREAGKPKITIKSYPADTSAAAALLAGKCRRVLRRRDAGPLLHQEDRREVPDGRTRRSRPRPRASRPARATRSAPRSRPPSRSSTRTGR